MTPPHHDNGPDEQVTVPGAGSRLASPSLPPTPIQPEVPSLLKRGPDPPVLTSEEGLTEEGTLDNAPLLQHPAGQPWLIWAAVGMMTVAILAALLLL